MPSESHTVSPVLSIIFRFRYGLHALIYITAFAISFAGSRGSRSQRVWLALPQALSKDFGVDLSYAIIALTAIAILFAFGGALLRTWGTAYLGSSVVSDGGLIAGAVVAGGPYRYLRNPLYLGTILHTGALCLLMSWAGALFAIAAIVALQAALIVSEERFLREKLGSTYEAYVGHVSRLIPRFGRNPTHSREAGRWGQAVLSEIYFWGVAISFAVLGWTYNAVIVLQGVVVSLGLSILVRGLKGRVIARSPGM